MVLEIVDSPSAEAWDRFVVTHTHRHLLQTSPWGALKAQFGWSADRVGLSRGGQLIAGAQLLYRSLPAGLGRLAYVAKGPLADWSDRSQLAALLKAMDAAACRRGAIGLTVEPDLADDESHRATLRELGFRPAALNSIQPRRTIVVDISLDEETILAAMKSKTRYNIRLAGRKGVRVREAGEQDLPAFHALTAATSARDRFGVHPPGYYDMAYRLFADRGWARLLLAEVDGAPVAGVMAFAIPPRAWYLYGASGDAHREKMPAYLLQWEAVRWAKSLGCSTYDLWGVPDEDEVTLEAEFTQRRGGLWGVYRFKRGFGGELVRSIGAWDRVYAPMRYRFYSWLVAVRARMLGGQRRD